jgi:hypothetical protein
METCPRGGRARATHPAVAEARAQTIAWVMNDGVALLVLVLGDVPDVGAAFALGACRVDEGLTFSGALRVAAISLEESRERREIRAESGVETARE